MSDLISREDAMMEARPEYLNPIQKGHEEYNKAWNDAIEAYWNGLKALPSAQPEIIRCKDCKLNPKYEWFGCPMSHLSEKQRPETAWCWKAERRTDG